MRLPPVLTLGYHYPLLATFVFPYSNFVRKITRMDNLSHIMCIYVCQHHILGGPLCSRALSLRIIAVPGLYCCTNCWFLNGCQIFAVPYVRSNVYLSHQNISARRERTVFNCVCIPRAQERYQHFSHSLLVQVEFECLFKSSFIVLTRNMESKQDWSLNCK